MLKMKGLFQTHNILLDIRGIEADKHIENTNTEDEESNNFPFLHLPALVWLSSPGTVCDEDDLSKLGFTRR